MEKITVQRANVVLTVAADAKDKFMDLGYSVINDKGEVLERALPTNVKALQTMVVDLESKLAEKEAEIAKLKKKATKAVEK